MAVIRKLYWLLGLKSKRNRNNKLRIYKAILKQVWTYGIQLWGTSSKSNVTIIERLQSKMLRIITIAPWFVMNGAISRNLHISTVKEEIERFSANYLDRLHFHPNPLANSRVKNINGTRRHKRKHVLDVATENNSN